VLRNITITPMNHTSSIDLRQITPDTTERKRSVIAIGTLTSTPLRSDMKPVYPTTLLLHLLVGKTVHTAAELMQFYETLSPVSNREQYCGEYVFGVSC
jgi:hypothetical protein